MVDTSKYAGMIRDIWFDRCSVTVREEVTDPETKLTDFKEAVIVREEPCRLSYSALQTASGEHTASAEMTAKLFISPDIEIPPGSRISIERHGRKLEFSRSGEPAVYTNHQEIELERFRGWT